MPGDIIVNDDHAAIVDRVIFRNDRRELDGGRSGILVIEATNWNNNWCVINKQTWTDLGANYNLKRLKISQ